MITPITATFPALNFPKEVDYPTQEDWAAFSAAAELNYGILSGEWSDKSEEFRSQTNNLALEIQEIGENAFNAISLNTIEDLATYTGTGLVIVKDLNRGGIFIYDDTKSYVNNGGTIFDGWCRQYSGAINVKWFGAKGDGVTDDETALTECINYVHSIGGGVVYLPIGTYTFTSSNKTFDGLSNITFIGDGRETSLIKTLVSRLRFVNCVSITFSNIGFRGNELDSTLQETIFSHYIDILFDSCSWRGYGSGTLINKAGSSCITMYAGDSGDGIGSSERAVFTNCHFYGNSRKTNFGIRVYTEFTTSQTATNTNVIIDSCTFGGFNWNAVELAGPNTYGCVISDCIANACGLTPFDIDKGAHNNTIKNVVINRLKGNIDTDVNQNTRTSAVNVAGYNGNLFAYGNTVSNVTVNLASSELNAYPNGGAVISFADCYNNYITDVNVTIDNVPVRQSGITAICGFAMVMYSNASDNVISNVYTKNCSSGIIQAASQTTVPNSVKCNSFYNFKNSGVMTEELIVIDKGASVGYSSMTYIKNFEAETDLSNPFITAKTNKYSILAYASGSSLHTLSMVDFKIAIPSGSDNFLIYADMYNIGVKDFIVNDNGTLLSTRFIADEGGTNCARVGINNIINNRGRTPMDFFNCMNNISGVSVHAEINKLGGGIDGMSEIYSSNTPSIAATSCNISQIKRLSYSAGGTLGWVNTGTWKTFGTISA